MPGSTMLYIDIDEIGSFRTTWRGFGVVEAPTEPFPPFLEVAKSRSLQKVLPKLFK